MTQVLESDGILSFSQLRTYLKDGTFNHADYKPKYSSKYTNVRFRKDCMKWSSLINVDGKMKRLGSFKTEEEAYEAQQKALKEYNL